MAMNLGKNDPYKNMDTGAKNIKRGSLFGRKEKKGGGDGADSGKDLRSREDELLKASEALGSREAEISEALENGEDSLAGAREREEAADGFYAGGGGKDSDNKKKGFLKGKGAMGFITALVLGTGAMMGVTQMFQPFSLLEQFRETFNSMHTSVNMRSNRLLRYQLDNGLIKEPTRVRFGKAEFSLSNKQKNKLSDNGIDYDEDMKALVYVDEETGRTKVVAADDSAAARIKGDFDIDGNTDVITFKSAYEDDLTFFRNYNNSSMTWRGAIANWFETATLKFLLENKLTRNLFADYKQGADESKANTKAATVDLISKGTDEIQDGGVHHAKADGEADTDGDGDLEVVFSEGGEEGSSGGGVITRSGNLATVDGVKAQIDDIRQKYGKADTGSGITGAAQSVANYTCLVFNFLGGVSLLVSASQALQIIHLVTAYFEAIDKVKAGEGDSSPIHTLTATLNEDTVNKHTTLTTPTSEVMSENLTQMLVDGSRSGYVDENNVNFNLAEDNMADVEEKLTKSVTPEDSYTTKTAMESSGIAALYSSDGKVDPNDPSVQSFNFTHSINTILGGIGVSMASFTGCSIAKLTTNALSILEQAWTTYACIAGASASEATFGVTLLACLPALMEVGSAILFSVAAGLLITGIISVLTPVLTTLLTRDLITNLGGEDLGNALTSGANMYMGNTHRFNGGSLANKEEYEEFAIAQQQVIADNAKYERSIRDPFDVTSKYTFVGTLLTQMMSFLSVNSLMSAVASTGTVVSSSIAAISPGAMAYSIANTLPESQEQYELTCPYLASIGAVGDAYCNPYAITDMSTIGEDPSVVIDDLSDNFLDEPSSDGNVRIKAGSDLAEYIIFCDNRNSAFGLADQNIVNQITDFATVDTDSGTFNNVTNSAIGAIPFIGDGIDVVNNAVAMAKAGYVDGSSCVAGNDATGTDWNTAKKYQRFIEDQSLMESMGLLEKSAVTAFLDEYYEQNPLDNSYEGILARYSGMTKEDVVAILDILDYGNYINNYDALARYKFGAPVVEEPNEILFDNDNVVAENTYIILLNEISFADVRNRSFVV